MFRGEAGVEDVEVSVRRVTRGKAFGRRSGIRASRALTKWRIVVGYLEWRIWVWVRYIW
jgi:hypothetical protein